MRVTITYQANEAAQALHCIPVIYHPDTMPMIFRATKRFIRCANDNNQLHFITRSHDQAHDWVCHTRACQSHVTCDPITCTTCAQHAHTTH